MLAPEVLVPPAVLPTLFIPEGMVDSNLVGLKGHDQEPLLGDALFSNTAATMPLSPTLSLTFSAPFPCLADELEEQAKALEVACSTGPTQQALSASKVLRQTGTPPFISGATQQPHHRMIPVDQKPGCSPWARSSVIPKTVPPLDPAIAPHKSEPQSVLCHYHQGATYPKFQAASQGQPLQQLHPPKQVEFNPREPSPENCSWMKTAPLAAALHNADCVRLGVPAPWPGTWSGCCVGPYCNREKCHPGACNGAASIPGLNAYLPEELAGVGLVTGAELTEALPPVAAALASAAAAAASSISLRTVDGSGIEALEGESTGLERFAPTCLKRKSSGFCAPPSPDAYDSESFTASDNVSYNGEEGEQEVTAIVLRSSKRTKAAAAARVLTHAPCMDEIVTDNEALSDEHRSSLTEETKLLPPTATESLGPRKKGRKGRKGNRAAGRTVAIAKGTAQPPSAPPGTSSRHVRKPPLVWVSGETRDPRSGKMVTVVPAATFCTQCSTLSTPVWRAGPFGHKTLCNACGVRWMKVGSKRK